MVDNINRGKTLSCGCLHREVMSARATHGRSRTTEHRIWLSMKRRCLDPANKAYKNYGGRGITVCQSWLKFEEFFSDMGLRPDPSMSIERRDNNAGYCPENCYWGTREEQANNKRNSLLLTFRGETLTVAMWQKRLGFRGAVVYERLKMGWSIERSLTEPCRKLPRRKK